MDPAQTIHAARLGAGMTQTDLARAAGTSQTAVSAYESGAKRPSLDTLVRLLGAAGTRLTVTRGARVVRTPSAADHLQTARTLEDVLDLAEKLPTRHAEILAYPRLT